MTLHATVFLGGTSVEAARRTSTNDWRSSIAARLLSENITSYNPLPSLGEKWDQKKHGEPAAKAQMDALVLLWVIFNDSRGVGSMLELVEHLAVPGQAVIATVAPVNSVSDCVNWAVREKDLAGGIRRLVNNKPELNKAHEPIKTVSRLILVAAEAYRLLTPDDVLYKKYDSIADNENDIIDMQQARSLVRELVTTTADTRPKTVLIDETMLVKNPQDGGPVLTESVTTAIVDAIVGNLSL